MIGKDISDKLSGFRGMGTIIVLMAHFFQIFFIPIIGVSDNIRYSLASIFYIVCLFFVLSGYVIADSIFRSYIKNGFFDARVFFINRLARIYPVLIFSLFLSALVYFIIVSFDLHGANSFRIEGDKYVAREKVEFSWLSYLLNLMLLHGVVPNVSTIMNNGPLWSVSLEAWAYLFAMSVGIILFNRNIFVGVFLVLFILFLILFNNNNIFIFYISIWCLGAFVYFMEKRSAIFDLKSFIICLSTCVFSIYIIFSGDYNIFTPFYSANSYYIQFFIVCIIVLVFVKFNKYFYWLNIFSRIEKCAYTLYAIHFPVLLLLFSFFHIDFISWSWFERLIFSLLSCTSIVIFSAFISRFLENRFFYIMYLSKLFGIKKI